MSMEAAVVLGVGGVLASLLYYISDSLRAIHRELQTTRSVMARFLACDKGHEMAWDGWPHMTARLLEEIQMDVRDFRRKMIGR